MKKTLLLALVAILFSANASAIGPDKSYTAFSITYNYQDVKTDYTAGDYTLLKDDFMLHGFSGGFIVHQQLVSYLFINAGVHYQFAMKDEKYDGVRYDIYNHNIKVPIKLAFSISFGGNSGLSIYAGPSLDFMVSTQSNCYYNSNNFSYYDMVNGRHIVETGGVRSTWRSNPDLGWFDIPLGVGASLHFGKFGLRFDYEWGMINRSLNSGYKWKADQLTAGVFFIF